MIVINKIIFAAATFGGAFIVMKTMEFFLTVRQEKWKKLLLWFGSYLLVFMVIFIGDPMNLPPALLLFLGGVVLTCEGTLLSKLTIGLIFASTGFSFNTLADWYRMPDALGSYTLVRLAFWALIYVLCRRYAPEKGYGLPTALWRLLLFLTMIPIGIVVTIVLLSPFYYFENMDRIMPVFIALLFIALVSNVGLIWTLIVLENQAKLERRWALAKISRKYYESMEAQQSEVRRLRHDMSNHLQTVLLLAPDERERYIKGLLQNPVFTQIMQYTGDPMVNAVISSKAGRMDKHHIKFHLNAAVQRELPFDKQDICAILANVFDNAIEACLKLPDEEREIRLDLKVEKGLFVVRMSNPWKGGNKGNDFQTTKKDRENHGYGLGSVREAVARYGGSLEIEAAGGECKVLIYMLLSLCDTTL